MWRVVNFTSVVRTKKHALVKLVTAQVPPTRAGEYTQLSSGESGVFANLRAIACNVARDGAAHLSGL